MNFKGLLAVFIERFHPVSHIPMLLLLVTANMALGAEYSLAGTQVAHGLVFALLFVLFFFRLRLFDEIKDYETDLKVNPARPLARGAISIDETKNWILIILILELAAVASLGGFQALAGYSIPVAYSLLMYNEFFIPRFLRPRLTTYAVSHTFVAALLAFFVISQTSHAENLNYELLVRALLNWAIFNLFEFARKSFAPIEERDEVPSYTKVFGIYGALILSFSQLLIPVLCLLSPSLMGFKMEENAMHILWGLSCIYLMVCVLAAVIKNVRSFRIFRSVSGLVILIFFAVVASGIQE